MNVINKVISKWEINLACQAVNYINDDNMDISATSCFNYSELIKTIVIDRMKIRQ